ncbi:hypothetical protein H109_01657 [Trichophyton interdigitale MR816]|uniref:Major facilitator superfamily (MFS) profile domain-containing protein n=1 Tax=Trichophyton interdigitale (strain MR816) TaxID=1215338 RepID=A0A059JF73_TRIIM|nr:hypothetical protein H101_05362 [Trichophyton interdigitale H6]KDB26536.1 hypothetical protein H109_01657 [Trichophyton interdigitale MR816]
MVGLEKDGKDQTSSLGVGGGSVVASSTTLPGENNDVDDAGYANNEHSYDTGWTAWSQVLASFFLFFNTWGVVTAFGVFQTYYEHNLLDHLSPSTISWIGSTQSFLLLFFGTIAGSLFDAGYTRQLLMVGWVLIPLGLMMTSIASQYWQIFLAQAICMGLGFGSVFVPCVAVLPQYFKKRRAIANGLAATGSGIGGLVYPIVFRQMQKSLGFPWATRVLGFIVFATMSISVSLLKMRFKPAERRSLVQLSAFRDPVYSLFCVSQFCGFLGLYNMMVYIQPYAIDEGIMGTDLAFYLLAILNSASTFGRIIPNYFVDLIGPFNVMIPMAFCSGIIALGWIGVHTTGSIIVIVILYGFFSGAFVSVPPVVLISITPDLRDFGTRLGMTFVFNSIGTLAGTPIGGAIIHASGNQYLGVQLLAGSCLLMSGILLVIARLVKSGPKLFIHV